jgi:hypothetical protein
VILQNSGEKNLPSENPSVILRLRRNAVIERSVMSKERLDHWIPVTTSSGMFSSEYAVSLKLVTGQAVSFFVDKDLIKETAGRHLLRVVLVDDYPGERKQRILLPTETFETASRWVEIATE